MAGTWQWKFPATRTYLWDGSPIGDPNELSLARNGRIYVQLSVSALHRALSHARMGSVKVLECYLIATSWIDNAEIMVVEMNRFDPGHSTPKDRSTLLPTSLMPGDIPIKTQVVLESPPDAQYLTHNLANLREEMTTLSKNLSWTHSSLDPALFTSLRVHCACTKEGVVNVQCGCVLPSLAYEATPIRSIPVVQTALARNLSGPLPISALQGKCKHGYLTMDSSRKLILLLHSDPKAPSLPLVGVWVSGVETDRHPNVWTACTSYIHSASLSDRVWGEGQKSGFLLLLYLKGSPQAHFMECRLVGRDDDAAAAAAIHARQPPVPVPYSMSSAQSQFQWMPDVKNIELELLPVGVSSALHTLLESAMAATVESRRELPTKYEEENVPPLPSLFQSRQSDRYQAALSPSPAPERVLRDSNLSVISSLSVEDRRMDSPLQQAKGRSRLTNETSFSSSGASGEADLTAPSASKVKAGMCEERMNGPLEPSLPSQEERMGMELASHCLDVLRSEGNSTCSELNSTAAEETGAFSREIGGILGGSSSVSLENSAISHEASTMHLDLRSYYNSSSSSGERSRSSRTPRAMANKHSEEENRESYSHLLQENEAEYYKMLLNQVLGGSQDARGEMEAKTSTHMESEETRSPPAHPIVTQASVSHSRSSASSSQSCGKNSKSEGLLRGDEVAGNERFSRNLTEQGSYPSSESSFSTPDPSSRTFNFQSFLGTSTNGSSIDRGGGGGGVGSTNFLGPGEVSLLSAPPSGINTMLLTAGLWGLDLSMDEDLHQADLIDRKYLQGTPDYGLRGGVVRGGGGSGHIDSGHGALQLGFDDTSLNQTLALSTTTYQFLDRHNIRHGKGGSKKKPLHDLRGRKQPKAFVEGPTPVPGSRAPQRILDVEKTKALQKFT